MTTRLAEVLASVLERRERGEAVDTEALIRAHPDLADELRVHFAAAQFVDAALAGLAPAASAPERIGAFRIERELGSGGMGTVYAARAQEEVPGVARGERVALKVVHPHLLRRAGFFRRFVREAEIGARVRHDNVVRTLFVDAAVEGEAPCHFLAMEYVEGQTLRDLVAEVERLPEELCRHVAREVAKGLAAIHAAGVVHRDLKPENVLITKDHAVKVMDLGVAQLQDEAIRLSQTGAFVGSLHYAAPEQLSGGEPIDGRADLHALGLVLYELATGCHPFGGDSDARAMLRKVLDETPRRCAELNPQLSPFFEDVVHTLLAKKRDDRFASAQALLAVLDEGEKSAWWRERAKAIRAATKRPLRRVRIPRETALYGRDAELSKLRALYERAKSGEGNVLLLEGEAGIGKSRLVDEFVGLLQRGGEDLNFLYGSYPPAGAATASGAFSTAYREQFGDEGSAGHLPQTPLLVPAFDALLRGESAPPGTEALTKDSLQTVFVHATRDLAAERPTIVLIDDLHFAPEEGRGLFASLALAVPGHRVLLVGTMRPGVPETWAANVTRLAQTTHVAIPRLGAKDLVSLLRDAFRSEHLAHELAGRIAEKSDGNPFFVFEIIRGLREGQLLRQRPDGTWETTQILRDITVPSSVLDLVNARVADLADEERNLLDVASCVGFEFDAGLVGDALGMARVPVLQSLAKIEKRHRLVRASGRVFVFDHHQVREALYGALPEPLREEYHAAIAEALERRNGAAENEPKDLDGALCAELAENFLKGAQGTRAVRYIEPAMAHLARSYANEDAIVLSDLALAVPRLVERERRVDMLLRKADHLDMLGRRDPQREAIESALALAQETGDRRREAWAQRCLGNLHEAVGRYAEAERCHARCLDLARVSGDRTGESYAIGALGCVLQSLGRYTEARERHERHLEIAREIGDRRGESLASGNLGTVWNEVGRYDEAERCHIRSHALAREAGDRVGEARAEGNLASTAWHRGRFDEAQERGGRALALNRAIGRRLGEAIAVGNLANVAYARGRFEESRQGHARHLALAREIGDHAGESRAVGNLHLAYWALGRFADALAHGERCLALARAIGDRMDEAIALVNLGLLRSRLGDRPGARRDLEASLAICRAISAPYPEGYALARLSDVEADGGDDDRARQLAEESLALRRKIGHGDGVAESLLAVARARLLAGRADEASSLLAEACASADECGSSGVVVLSAASLAACSGGAVPAALSALAANSERLRLCDAMEARHLLFQATLDRAHLVEAKRLLDFIVEHAPPECREPMLANVRLHREIAAAANEAGL